MRSQGENGMLNWRRGLLERESSGPEALGWCVAKMRTWLQASSSQVGADPWEQNGERVEACPGNICITERKGACKEPENEWPEGRELNKEAMVSYKEEDRTFGGEIHQLSPKSWERTADLRWGHCCQLQSKWEVRTMNHTLEIPFLEMWKWKKGEWGMRPGQGR